MTKRMQKRAMVFDNEQYDGEWPPENAAECVAWFSRKLEYIPEEHRATAKIEIDSVGGYEGEHYARIQIYYDRPETDDEMAERETYERRYQEEVVAKELQTLAALKAKYKLGDKSAPYTEHHIWCNFWGTPVETCRQCKGLYNEYPMNGMSGDELQQKYFPNVIKREGT